MNKYLEDAEQSIAALRLHLSDKNKTLEDMGAKLSAALEEVERLKAERDRAFEKLAIDAVQYDALLAERDRERKEHAQWVRELEGALVEQRDNKDGAYLERNRLVALLASMFPSGIKRTAIEGWSADWNGCVYIDFPWGQASWHYHDSHAFLFDHLPPYQGSWDGHTTDQKYAAIAARSKP